MYHSGHPDRRRRLQTWRYKSVTRAALGGLVALSEKESLQRVVSGALQRATRCSSDPICARRTPADPEDFHRFLDRRFLIDLPGSELGFFGRVG